MNNLKEYYLNSKKVYKGECDNPNVQWGSTKPITQTCKSKNIQMNGPSCNNIWNNNTKRKIIVTYK